ncbi:MAG: F0F1 ATP synthase subunit A [Saprospiraceae bacterium]|nr:F0F1 ATP synthase subunit A [Saprospiraceae bacterium]
MRNILLIFAFILGTSGLVIAQSHEHSNHATDGATHVEEGHDSPAGHDQGAEAGHEEHAGQADHGHGHCFCDSGEAEEGFEVSSTAFHHIGDANTFHIIGEVYVPLPCILYAPDHGWNVMMASKFDIGHHGTGNLAIDRYVLVHGEVNRIADTSFPMGEISVECVGTEINEEGEAHYVVGYQGNCYHLESKSTLDQGVFGGGITSYYDLSITKNVFTMLLGLVLLFWMFRSVATAYKKRRGEAPRGIQGLMEPIILFIQDEVAKPFLGAKYSKYLPFLLSIFFFILGLNLIGQIPFFPGSANVTGNLGVTMVLALFTFFIVSFSGNKHYWEHIFWMPGVPAWVKIILTPVEVLGIFIKPFTLMLRLFANITAGHIVIMSFVGLIFIFGNSGESLSGAGVGIAASIPLTLFMMAIELLVAFIQAFVFTLLAASYIGAAIEEPHHH